MQSKLGVQYGTVEADLRVLLSPSQRRAWDDAARIRYLLCGRRGGKTWLCAAWLLDGARQAPNSLSVYLALSKESARRIVWPAMRDVALAAGIDPSCLHEHTLTVKLPNGSQIVCAGTDDARTIESWRGTKLLRAVVDECGSQPESFLAYLIGSILRPALMDLRGELLCAGTPGLVLKGWWFEQTGEHRTSEDGLPPLHKWTVLDNPAIPHAAEELELERASAGANDAQFRREWLAEWTIDAGGLVFPVEIGRNTSRGLPRRNRQGDYLHPASWRFVIGVDCGYKDATAFVVTAAHPNDTRMFVVHVEKHTEMIPRQVAAKLAELRSAKWQWTEENHFSSLHAAPIVMDTGGLGKPYAEECIRVFRIPVEPAEKREKEGNIRLTRGDVLTGKVVLLDGPFVQALADEWACLGWDEDGRFFNENQEDHATDACLYAFRRLRHYTDNDSKPKTAFLSEEWYKEEEIRMRTERIRRHREAAGGRTPWLS